MNQIIVILDYGMGNLFSVSKKISSLGHNPIISSDSKVLKKADKLIIPGVGHFGKAMKNLSKLNLIEELNEYALIKQKPVLGICLGMQLMASFSEEGECNGLNWFDAEVKKFKFHNQKTFKSPHMGWNNIKICAKSILMKNLNKNSKFYFIHSYYTKVNNRNHVLNETSYENTFVSAIQKDNIYGVQYHPEKSHDSGGALIKNFIEL